MIEIEWRVFVTVMGERDFVIKVSRVKLVIEILEWRFVIRMESAICDRFYHSILHTISFNDDKGARFES